MKTIVKYIIYILSLLLIELICMFWCFFVENLIKYKLQFLLITHAAKDALDVNMLRGVFYSPLYVAVFIYMLRHINGSNRVVKIAFINCGLYILISLLYGFILMPFTMEYFFQSFFYYFIISTFISPFILNKIPYYKKLIASMKGATPSPATPVVEEEVENPVEDFVIPKKNITLPIVLKYLLFTLALFIVEALVFTAESMFFVHKHHFHLPYMLDMVLFCINFSATKFMFYYSLQIIPFICLMSEIGGESRILKIAGINGGLYIVVSLVHAFILTPETTAYFSEGFFYIFILATFASPFILTQIPYFKKLALELQQPHAPHMFKRFLDLLLKSA